MTKDEILKTVQEYNPNFTKDHVKGTPLGIAERCGDDAVIIRKGDSITDMKKSGIFVCYLFPIKGKRASTIYDSLTGFDDAIIGVTLRAWKGKEYHVLVYDQEKRLEVYMKKENWTYEQAQEWSGFNDNAWQGPTTPLIMTRMKRVLGEE